MSLNTPGISDPQTQAPLLATTITDEDGLARHEHEWRTLADQCVTATVFQTFEWNAAWWRHYGHRPGRRLRLLSFRDGQGRLVGLAPLMTSFWYGTPLRRLSFLGTGASDYLDLIAAPGSESAVADAFYAELTRRNDWHVADLHQQREGGLLRSHPGAPAAGLTRLVVDGERCPYIALPDEWDALTRQFGKKTRTNIGYHDRSLQKVYTVDVGFVTDPDTLGVEMTRLFELHQRRWNQRWLPGVFGSKSVRKFHRDVAQSLLGRGWLRLFYLRLDGQTQACLYCFAFGDRVCYYQGGFEPTLAKWSLGTVLTARALQSAIQEQRSVFDFLRGDEPYKAKWTTAATTNHRFVLTKDRRLNVAWLAERGQKLEAGVERRAKEWARQCK